MPNTAATFARLLEQVEDGQLAAELTERMTALVADMTRLAKNSGGKPKGKIALTLEFKLDDGVMEIRGDVKVAAPKPPRARSIFYPAADGALQVNNPRQLDLGMGASEPRETRSVSTAPAEQRPLQVSR